MKKSELEHLIIKNIDKANKEIADEGYWDIVFEKNLEILGSDNPNVAHQTFQLTTLKIMSKALTETLIDLKVVDVDV